jgi:hypothetical protein
MGITKGQSTMDNPNKLVTLGTQVEEKQNKDTKQYVVLDTTMRKQTQITYITHEAYYKQLEVKTNRTVLVCVCAI